MRSYFKKFNKPYCLGGFMRRAFTLIEMVCVLGIISIILSISVLKLGSFYGDVAKDEAESFVRDLNYARRLALSSKKDVEIIIKDGGRGYIIKNKGSKSEETFKDMTLSKVSLSKATGKQNVNLYFTYKGSVSNACTYRLSSDSLAYKVTVQPATGKINLYKGG